MSEHVQINVADGCLTIELARPERKNALTAAMYRALHLALQDADHRDDVRVVVLHGQPECFSAGNDLAEFSAIATGSTDPGRDVEDFLLSLARLCKPLVVAVNGVAVGIGTTLLLHADFVIAGESARFQLPFVNLGLCAEGGSSLLLPLRAGHLGAAKLLLLGEMIDAAEARAMGIVSEVVADGESLTRARAIAERLCALPVAALQATKQLMKSEFSGRVESAMQDEFHHFRKLLFGPAAREALAAFAERRPPDFRAAGA